MNSFGGKNCVNNIYCGWNQSIANNILTFQKNRKTQAPRVKELRDQVGERVLSEDERA